LVEDDNVIDTVEEFRTEVSLEFITYLALHALIITENVIRVVESKS